METTKQRVFIKNRRLSIELPSNFENSEVEVIILKLRNIKNENISLNNFLSYSIHVDKSITYPNREERNAR